MYEGKTMVDITTLQSKVLAIAAQQLEKNNDQIDTVESLLSQGADELDCIEIVMRLEEQFGLEINDTDADLLTSVDAIVEYLQKHTKE